MDKPTREELRERVVKDAGSMVADRYHTKLSLSSQRRVESILMAVGKLLTKLIGGNHGRH